jgi:hypothetical protein
MKTRKSYLIKRGKTFHAVCQIDGRKFMKTTRKTDREKAQVELKLIALAK